MPRPYPAEFRARAVALVRAGRPITHTTQIVPSSSMCRPSPQSALRDCPKLLGNYPSGRPAEISGLVSLHAPERLRLGPLTVSTGGECGSDLARLEDSRCERCTVHAVDGQVPKRTRRRNATYRHVSDLRSRPAHMPAPLRVPGDISRRHHDASGESRVRVRDHKRLPRHRADRCQGEEGRSLGCGFRSHTEPDDDRNRQRGQRTDEQERARVRWSISVVHAHRASENHEQESETAQDSTATPALRVGDSVILVCFL